MTELCTKKCVPCEGGISALDEATVQKLLRQLNGWEVNKDNIKITKRFDFKNYYQTIAFVSAIAWFSHQEDHHPDLEVSYNHCVIHYSTHAIKGLSENDFICAAKVDALLA
jgi:4a-hydroxytetrahydrobiopterin dehydratase